MMNHSFMGRKIIFVKHTPHNPFRHLVGHVKCLNDHIIGKMSIVWVFDKNINNGSYQVRAFKEGEGGSLAQFESTNGHNCSQICIMCFFDWVICH